MVIVPSIKTRAATGKRSSYSLYSTPLDEAMKDGISASNLQRGPQISESLLFGEGRIEGPLRRLEVDILAELGRFAGAGFPIHS
jgi:hypothetical protein